MTEQILNITTNLGFWGEINKHKNVVISIESKIGSFESKDILTLNTGEYIPQKGDKIYFLPGVNIPRVKLKNVALEYGIKSVRSPFDADVFFGNKSTVDKITNSNWHYKIDTKYLTDALDNEALNLDSFYIDKLKTALEYYTNEFITVDHPLKLALLPEGVDADQSKTYFISDDFTDLGKALIGKTIYEETTMVDKLNGKDASVIDEEMYEQLTTMFDSSDNDNHVLAMEIMANCKYNASLVYLLLLFKKQNHLIGNSNTKNHVNFKSLISWISDNIMYRNSIDDICRILHEKGQFTPDKLDIILNHSKEDIIDRGDHTYFKVKTITVDAQFLAEMNFNYDYQVQEEYTPYEIVEDEVEEVEPIGIEEAPESEFAVEDNFEPEAEIIPEEVIETPLELEPVSNNHQITQTNESDIDWF
jgi:hypothetical protein